MIPARDEEGLVGEIVDLVRPYADEVLVVDGHSRDRTREIALEHGARVILDRGKGKGDALRLALDEALRDRRSDATIARARDIKMVAILAGRADMVVGRAASD